MFCVADAIHRVMGSENRACGFQKNNGTDRLLPELDKMKVYCHLPSPEIKDGSTRALESMPQQGCFNDTKLKCEA